MSENESTVIFDPEFSYMKNSKWKGIILVGLMAIVIHGPALH
ncbi:hypothetical protein QG37_03555 [Candidozyma auris]|uniref:Uncharacterized protein n=1 Tax=Candidozyma auris TaxID=498019 RepID=A0A0L0P0C9_CANAR|nr:hypothetical protein QG37_03555 [[Candida] auris]